MSKKHKADKAKAGKEESTKGKGVKDSESKGKNSLAVIAAKQPDAASAEAQAALPVASKNNSDGSGHGLGDRQMMLISKALADPTRMAVLRAIAKGGATCSGMRDCAGVSAATLSHHMKELESAGLIENERKGRFVEPKFQRKMWKKYLDELKSLAK